MTSRQLPPRPHPTASAFFDAFDASHDVVRSGKVARIRNSLGWRTRYTSSALYPVSIRPVKGRRRISEGEDEEELASFHVRQVFPRRSDRGRGEVDDGAEEPTAPVSEDDCEFGTGATVWPGSIVLLKYLELLAHDPTRDNVLEGAAVADLGSGTAVTSVAAALLGADSVVCTDGCDPVVDLARRNVRDAISLLGPGGGSGAVSAGGPARRGPYDLRGCEMSARKYRWGEGMPPEGSPGDTSGDCNLTRGEPRAEKIDESEPKRFDVILGADCIVPKLYPIEPLVDALDELSDDDTVSYLSYERRYFEAYDPAAEFRRLAGARGLGVEVVPERELHPAYPADDIQVWRVTRTRRGRRADPNEAWRGMQQGSGRSDHKSLLVGKNS